MSFTCTPGDSRLEARIASYELAARMQLAVPEVLDLHGDGTKPALVLLHSLGLSYREWEPVVAPWKRW